MKKNLCIISNESVSKEGNSYFCDNIDLKSIPEGLNDYFDVDVIARNSSIKRAKEIKIKNITTSKNIYLYILSIFKALKKNYENYLLISLTPNTFFAAIILIIYKKNFYLYLRSDGFVEYQQKIGFLGFYIYKFMYFLVCPKANLISCNEKLFKGMNGQLVKPSQLNNNWLEKKTPADLSKIKLLYVGRLKKEKGIFSLINLLDKSNMNFSLSIMSNELTNNFNYKRKFINILKNCDHELLIKIYDSHNIFILPSYTESYSQVVDEALARGRPVIIFKEIEDIVFANRKGVFVANRNTDSLEGKIKYIIKNYYIISKEINKTVLPSKAAFIKSLIKIIEKNI